MKEGLNKKTLKKLYVKEGKSTYAIAKMFCCSPMTVLLRCKKYMIKTRPRGGRIKKIKKSVLQKLYVKEGKSIKKVAELLSCSPLTVSERCRQYGIKTREPKRIKGTNKILRSVYFDKRQLERLDVLSAKTRVPKAVYIREALDLMLGKYENELKGSLKKREGR